MLGIYMDSFRNTEPSTFTEHINNIVQMYPYIELLFFLRINLKTKMLIQVIQNTTRVAIGFTQELRKLTSVRNAAA